MCIRRMITGAVAQSRPQRGLSSQKASASTRRQHRRLVGRSPDLVDTGQRGRPSSGPVSDVCNYGGPLSVQWYRSLAARWSPEISARWSTVFFVRLIRGQPLRLTLRRDIFVVNQLAHHALPFSRSTTHYDRSTSSSIRTTRGRNKHRFHFFLD